MQSLEESRAWLQLYVISHNIYENQFTQNLNRPVKYELFNEENTLPQLEF
jgi:hypothetical protein